MFTNLLLMGTDILHGYGLEIFFIFDRSYLYPRSVLGPIWVEISRGGGASLLPLSFRVHKNYAGNFHKDLNKKNIIF